MCVGCAGSRETVTQISANSAGDRSATNLSLFVRPVARATPISLTTLEQIAAPKTNDCTSRKAGRMLEARVGIEPTHKGFADLSLTTWVPRPCSLRRRSVTDKVHLRSTSRLQQDEIWSGRRDLNPRLRPWQGRTLPLSYSRSTL